MRYYREQNKLSALLGQAFLISAIVASITVWGMFSYVFIQGVLQ